MCVKVLIRLKTNQLRQSARKVIQDLKSMTLWMKSQVKDYKTKAAMQPHPTDTQRSEATYQG